MVAHTLRSKLYLWPALTFLAGAAMLGGAWGFQILGGLYPCTLCLYQRWPHWAVIVIAGLATLGARRLGTRGIALTSALCGLIFLAGAGVAGFHAGVEQHWWEGLAACGNGDLNNPNMSIEELKTRLLAAPVARCDDVPWSLFGVSLAGYNFLASFVFALASIWVARAFWRKAT
jgi:disulfide bond formation protein DsbB